MSEKNNVQQILTKRGNMNEETQNLGTPGTYTYARCVGGVVWSMVWLRYAKRLYLCESVKWAGHQHDMGLPTYEDVLMMNAMATRNVTL